MAAFQTTRWTLICAAGTDSAPARRALDELFRNYQDAVHAYFRRAMGSQEADELAQGFFLHFIERSLQAHADPDRGRFRNFLLTALQNYLRDELDRRHASKRGAQARHLEFDDRLSPTDGNAPEQAFEQGFARTVIARALQRLAQEARALGRESLFDALRPFLIESPDADDYRDIAARLQMRPNTVATAVRRLRLRLRGQVRQELADTVADDNQLDDELKHLRNTLRAS